MMTALVGDGLDLSALPGELPRLKLLLKLCLSCLAVTVLAELVAGYTPAALADFLTVLYGVMLLRRDVHGLAQGLPVVTLIAGLNCALQAFSVLQLLSRTPGASHFLSDTCVVSVPQVKDGQTVHKQMDLCSWQTIVGNVAMCFAVVLEFTCMRITFKMFKSVHEAASSALISLLDVEGGASRGYLEADGPGADSSSAGAQDPRGARRSMAPPPGISGSAAQNFVGQGFTPYQGQAHRLVD